jgi:predicted phosphodiesterase
MKIGFLSDAHGNSLMLAACLRKLRDLGASSIYFLGDAVGYLPGEGEVLRLLRAEGVQCQKGNHEAMLLGELPLPSAKDESYRLGAARARLSAADREYIAGWPDHRILEVCGRRLLLVHGSPRNYLQEYVYPDGDLSALDGLGYDAVFMGHTHYPFVARRHGTLIVNAGSCGLPRDQGGLAAFALFDADTNDCEIYRLQLDSDEIVRHFGAGQMARDVYRCLFRKPSATPFGQRVGDTGV